MMNFQVTDMTCGHCASAITAAIKAAAPAAIVDVDLSLHQVRVDSVTDVNVIENAIRDAGYTPDRQS